MSTFNYRAFFSTKSAPFDLPTVTHTFDDNTIVAPASWSLAAARTLARHVAEQSVPAVTIEVPGHHDVPAALRPHKAASSQRAPETHYQQIVHRVAGSIAFGAVAYGILDAGSAEALYRDITWLIARQYLAPSTTILTSAGLHWAYGLPGPDAAFCATDPTNGRISRFPTSYVHPHLATCIPAPRDPAHADARLSGIDTVGHYRFGDTIHAWHTAPHYGPVDAASRCGILTVDDSACTLGTLNLGAFLRGYSLDDFDVDGFRRAAHALAIFLDVAGTIAGYPSAAIAINASRLHNIGANLTNLGALLMRAGIPYDDPRSRAFAAGVHSLLTSECYRTSTYMAKALGPSIGFTDNYEDAKRVIYQHAAATNSAWSDNPIFGSLATATPARAQTIDPMLLSKDLRETLRYNWETAIVALEEYGLRIMQATLAAPTPRVSALLDAHTNSLEPVETIAEPDPDNPTITVPYALLIPALIALAYPSNHIADIVNHIRETGSLSGAPHVLHEHDRIFQTATAPNALTLSAHLDMLAAVSPHVSGAVVKRIQLAENATLAEIAALARDARELGIKEITVSRAPNDTQPGRKTEDS